MKDSSHVREAFRPEGLLIAGTREAQLSFITPLLQQWQLLRLEKCEPSDGCLIISRVFISLIWSERR